MKKIIALLTILFLFNFPMSCKKDECTDSCCGMTFEPRYTKIESLTSKIGNYNKCSLEDNIFWSNRSYNYDDMCIGIIADQVSQTYMQKINRNSFSFINTAYACSPSLPEPKDEVTNIIITSEAKVFFDDKEYEKGTSLNELFYLPQINTSLDVYTGNPDSVFYRHCYSEPNPYRLFNFGFRDSKLIFQLKAKPDQEIKQKFSFEIELDGKKNFNIVTEEFQVKI